MTTFSNGESGLSVRTKINAAITTVDGLGTISTQNSNAVAITGGTIAGIADLAVADGGTGASTAATARTNLGAQETITGAATTIATADLTASRALTSNASGKVAVSAVTSTELGYVSGVTSAIQTQLNAKAALAGPAFTGQASFADGSAAAPSIAHTGDLNAGLFFPAADTVAVSTAGTERVRVDSSGNVGIGTTSPSQKLDVRGNTGSNLVSLIKNDGAGRAMLDIDAGGTSDVFVTFMNQGTVTARISSDNANNLRFGTGSSATERMRIDASGNVGIGTSSPASKLDVSGTIRDQIGDVRDLVNSSKTSAYVPAATDNGKLINITTGGITINTGVFAAGQNVTIYNNSASSQTITQGSGVTMYLAGTATTGNRTLAQRGIATILCVASNTFVCSGAGVT